MLGRLTATGVNSADEMSPVLLCGCVGVTGVLTAAIFGSGGEVAFRPVQVHVCSETCLKNHPM